MKDVTAEDVRVKWGQRIASKRRGNEVTQLQLATQLGYDPQTISRLERGEMGSLETYLRVAQSLDVDLFGDES